jgi:hypothetical protein
MRVIFGIALSLASVAVFYYSLPRDGKMAKFVGTEWEGYAVVAMICVFGVGALLTITGLAQAVK